jgi:hypothetical protein
VIGKFDRQSLTLVVLVMLTATVQPAAAGKTLPARRPQCDDLSSDQFFFPEGWLREHKERPKQDQFVRDWYSRHLRAMSEPSLSCREPPGEEYRFLWLRTWGRPIAVRVAGSTKSANIVAVELDGAGGYQPGTTSRRIERKLTDGEWTEVKDRLKTIDFWNAPIQIPDIVIDGAQWVLEGRMGAQYHVVDRASPKTGAYREFCLSLLKMAGLLPAGGGGKREAIY